MLLVTTRWCAAGFPGFDQNNCQADLPAYIEAAQRVWRPWQLLEAAEAYWNRMADDSNMLTLREWLATRHYEHDLGQ
jgi:hypothetical protein